VVDSVYVPDGVLEAQVSPNDRFVYVAGYFSASLSVVRTSDLQVTQIPFYYDYPWWGAGAGGRMVCSPDGKYVYATYYREDYLAVIRTANQTVVDSLMLGEASVVCLAISSDGGRLYAAVYPDSGYSAGFIIVVKLPDNTVEDTIFTLGANNNVSSMRVSPNGSRLYAVDQGEGRICAIRLSDKSIEWQDSASAAKGPRGIVLHPTGNPLYVLEDRRVSVRESSTGAVIDSIPLRPIWNGGISSDGAFLYVMCRDSARSDAVAVVRTSDNKLLRTITMPLGVADLAPSWDGLRMYVASTEDEALYVLGR
jgi:DNA-binding beta-propeller fold protein YncE